MTNLNIIRHLETSKAIDAKGDTMHYELTRLIFLVCDSTDIASYIIAMDGRSPTMVFWHYMYVSRQSASSARHFGGNKARDI